MRATRERLTPAQRRKASFAAAQRFIRNRKLSRSRSVAVYLATADEIDPAWLTDALLRAGCEVYAPKLMRTHPMHLVRFTSATPLRRRKRGIAQPACHAPRALPRQLDLILLPLLAFDDQGRRLGTGGGYYDRMLARPRSCGRPLLVGCAYAVQQVRSIPEDVWDRRLDAILTERGIIWFKRDKTWPTG
jgi:5-formyltetrahydrofolate cyclo-ligase